VLFDFLPETTAAIESFAAHSNRALAR
jgi:hypothetical protein